MWSNYDTARWRGVRDVAHEKLYVLLTDDIPEVRLGISLLTMTGLTVISVYTLRPKSRIIIIIIIQRQLIRRRNMA